MRVWIFLLIVVSVFAADEQKLALSVKAQSAFDRTAMAGAPDLKDATACIQAEAAMLPVASSEEAPLYHYQKGYCTLASAVNTQQATEFQEAAAEFDKAIEGWPARAQAHAKNKPPEPMPSALRVLAAVARLEAGTTDQAQVDHAEAELMSATAAPVCGSTLVAEAFCQEIHQTGRDWLGWIALRRQSYLEAERDLADSKNGGWREWVAGQKAFRDRNYREAAEQYGRAIEVAKKGPAASLAARLSPQPDVAAELVELGGAQLLAGDASAAIATLDAALKARPTNSRALFLRARGKEAAGQIEAALADYNLASRAAFAGAQDLQSGEAHLYRGILYYRRKDYTHAEDEFASALNFEIPGGLRPDAVAWRHMAAVASGSCDTSKQFLERSLGAVSPYFPKNEARAVIAACPAVTAGSVGMR